MLEKERVGRNSRGDAMNLVGNGQQVGKTRRDNPG